MKIVRKQSKTSTLKRNKKLFITLKVYLKKYSFIPIFAYSCFCNKSCDSQQTCKAVYCNFTDVTYKYKYSCLKITVNTYQGLVYTIKFNNIYLF